MLARGEGVSVTDRSIDVHVVSLRKKLGTEIDYIETVRGVGYKFTEKY
jgi:two-component system phosphate regulon response regulator PhoB